jgi:hypothetical protein
MNGMAMKMIMIVPCELKIWSKCSGLLGAHHDGVDEAAHQHD